MTAALLVIDIQKDFFQISEETSRSLHAAIETINAAIEIFRTRKFPVVSIQHLDEKDGLMPGKESFDLPDELHILPSDLHIRKTYNNAFNKTELEKQLRLWKADPLILTGFCAENCVLSTYSGAEDLDFHPILLRGALVSDNAHNIHLVEDISEVVSLGALEHLLAI